MGERVALPGTLGLDVIVVSSNEPGRIKRKMQPTGDFNSMYLRRHQLDSNSSLPKDDEPKTKLRKDQKIITDFPFLAQLLECPICFEYILPPIQQCRNGHLLCTGCSKKVVTCPVCKEPKGNIRNLAMEEIASKLMFPCTFSVYGCREAFGISEKAKHEICCDFHPYSCPSIVTNCTWVGALDEFVPHLVSHFTTISTVEDHAYTFIADSVYDAGTIEWAMFLKCYQQQFLVLVKKDECNVGFKFEAGVYLVGIQGLAQTFAYRVQLNGPNRQMQWKMPTHTLQGNVSSSPLRQCLVLDQTVIDLFKNDNGDIKLEITIEEA